MCLCEESDKQSERYHLNTCKRKHQLVSENFTCPLGAILISIISGVWPVPQQVTLALLPALPIDLGAWHLILGCHAICGIGELLDLVLHLLVYWANLA